ncbi:MAG: hypothetical protein R3C46_08335 [Hyphomonadaceae bacterium]
MTVAIAAKCWWSYQDHSSGWGLVAASERRLTTGDTHHSLPSMKGMGFGYRTWMLASGAIQAHSHLGRLLLGSFPSLGAEGDETTCWQLAQEYGELFKKYRQDRAESDVLTPLGYTTESFLDKMQNVPEAKAIEIMNRLEDYRLDFEALFLGYDERREPCILEVDSRGKVTNHESLGYGSIGSGSAHANAHMMFTGYKPIGNQFDAIWSVFCAKKRAEAAPGVGPETDLVWVNKNGVGAVDVRIVAKLEAIYARSRTAAEAQAKRAADALGELADKLNI